MPPRPAPLRLIAGHVRTLNVKQVLRRIWIEGREDVRNFGPRGFFLQGSLVKGASFNRNTKFKMLNVCVSHGAVTL